MKKLVIFDKAETTFYGGYFPIRVLYPPFYGGYKLVSCNRARHTTNNRQYQKIYDILIYDSLFDSILSNSKKSVEMEI